MSNENYSIMQNPNQKTTAENLNEKSQRNASASKNNLLKWIVIENLKNKDCLVCEVYECDEYQYKMSVIKRTERLLNAKVGEVIKECKLEYNFESPDGITVSMENFNSREEANEYLSKWVAQFKKQGYYSSVKYGKIELNLLKEFCDPIRIVIEDDKPSV